jgi:hypothetical protein
MRAARFILASSLVAAFASVLCAATPTRAAGDAGADAGAGALPACVSVKTASRYVPYGYNHVVTLTNGCTKSATCTISTDVNPTPTSAEVATGTTVEVLTFSGSPAATFFARVTCKLH